MQKKIYANMSEEELIREINALNEEADAELVEELGQAEDERLIKEIQKVKKR